MNHRVRFICCFFFSSRRRHTRLRRDWSSDVCSSDLNNYKHDKGIAETLLKMGIRIGYGDKLNFAFNLYKENIALFNDDFNMFFLDIIVESENFIQKNTPKF